MLSWPSYDWSQPYLAFHQNTATNSCRTYYSAPSRRIGNDDCDKENNVEGHSPKSTESNAESHSDLPTQPKSTKKVTAPAALDCPQRKKASNITKEKPKATNKARMNDMREQLIGSTAYLAPSELISGKAARKLRKKGVDIQKKRKYMVYGATKKKGQVVVDAQCMSNNDLSVKECNGELFTTNRSYEHGDSTIKLHRPCWIEWWSIPEVVKRYECQARDCSTICA